MLVIGSIVRWPRVFLVLGAIGLLLLLSPTAHGQVPHTHPVPPAQPLPVDTSADTGLITRDEAQKLNDKALADKERKDAQKAAEPANNAFGSDLGMTARWNNGVCCPFRVNV